MGVVEKWDSAKDGELNEANMTKKLTGMGYKCQKFDYPAGKAFSEHAHSEENRDCVLSGTFEVTISGKTVKLGAGDMLLIPSNAKHSCKCDTAVVLIDAQK